MRPSTGVWGTRDHAHQSFPSFLSINYSASVISDYYFRGQFDGGGKPDSFQGCVASRETNLSRSPREHWKIFYGNRVAQNKYYGNREHGNFENYF